MDYLTELGGLALGSRLKRLSERIAQDVAAIYSEQKLAFEPRWFPVFRLLGKQGQMAIMDIATALSVTHPAVNQVASELLSAQLIVQVTDAQDKRKRLLALSKKGQKLYAELEATWRVILESVDDVIAESGYPLLKALTALEVSLNARDLLSRFKVNEKNRESGVVEIVDFTSAERTHFKRLNEEWIEKFFELELADVEVLSAPEKIIENGGHIFFARVGKKIVGTCALIKLDSDVFEVAKMAVSDAFQGMGLGRLLLERCIEQARKNKAKAVTLETNRKLGSAVNLYKKAGFKIIPAVDAKKSKYSRVDLVMKIDLQPAHV